MVVTYEKILTLKMGSLIYKEVRDYLNDLVKSGDLTFEDGKYIFRKNVGAITLKDKDNGGQKKHILQLSGECHRKILGHLEHLIGESFQEDLNGKSLGNELPQEDYSI